MICEACGTCSVTPVCVGCERSGVLWAIGWVQDLAGRGLEADAIARVVGASVEAVNRVMNRGVIA